MKTKFRLNLQLFAEGEDDSNKELENLSKRVEALETENKSLSKSNEELTKSVKEATERAEKLEKEYRDSFESKREEKGKETEDTDVFSRITNARK